MILVEGCAGGAALTLHLLGDKPPIHYQGGKRLHVAAIAKELGLIRPDRAVLVEPGPWGRFWRFMAGGGQEARRELSDNLMRLAHRDPRELWHSLTTSPPPEDEVAFLATWATLQFWSYGNKPVFDRGGRWVTPGFIGKAAYRAEQREAALKRGVTDAKRWAKWSPRLPDLAERILDLPPLDCLDVVVGDVRNLEPISGALLYLDPPYADTTDCYGWSLPRVDVLSVARRWAVAGAQVAVSEKEALDLGSGWRSVQLPGPRGAGRNFSANKQEWLTIHGQQ